jgi:hypothetical protein
MSEGGSAIERPSRWSFYWWMNFFSGNPASAYSKEGRTPYYTNEGFLCSTTYHESNSLWMTNPTCCYVMCHDPEDSDDFWTRFWYARDDRRSYGALGFVILASIVMLPLVLAGTLVFHYPPVMIVSWTALFISSFSETIVDGTSICMDFRWVNLASAAWTLVMLVVVTIGVFQMQKLYNYYYPGTPHVKVNCQGLLKFFKFYSLFYWLTLAPSGLLLLWLIGTIVISHKAAGSCPWTFCTMCSWGLVHFLNMLAGSTMAVRMSKKLKLLTKPPARNVPVNPSSESPVIESPSSLHATEMNPSKGLIDKQKELEMYNYI